LNLAQALIVKITAGEDREGASKRLAGLGAAAVEPIMSAIRSMSAPPFLMAQVLFQIEDRNSIEPLLRFTRDESTMVQLSSIEALGYLCSPVVRQSLLELLLDRDLIPTARRVAAYSIGICGSPESVPALVEAQDQAMQEGEEELAIACAVSRARLGDHGGLSSVLGLTLFKGDETIRASAVRAFRFIAGPGVFPALAKSLKDRASEVKQAAVEAIYYIGNYTAMEQLLLASSNRDDTTANNARTYLGFLTGAEVSNKTAERKKWWAACKTTFRTEWCYRNGNPVDMDQFAALLDNDSNVPDIARDFMIYTGQWIGSEAWIIANPEEARSRVLASLSRLKGQFERGALYKSGKKFDLPALIEDAS
jgi:HEAT repeats